MTRIVQPDQLHRLIKLVLDTGEAQSLEEAEQMFAKYQLGIEVGRDVASSPTLQVAILTAVNTGRRSFLGGVQVAGALDIPLCVPWGRRQTLGEAILDLKGNVVDAITPGVPRLVVGNCLAQGIGEFALRMTFDGWNGGVVPLEDDIRLSEHQECIPSGVLAGALGVAEAFQFVRGTNAIAGRRDSGLSLWCPDSTVSWLTAENRGPTLERLPSQLWLIGLGNLGQAFLWTLGFLPYAEPDKLKLVLQDYDTLVEANDSTSLLTRASLIGQKKTRAMARWCEDRGFRTTINERRFAHNFRVADDEPHVALCGVDNALARTYLEDAGFGRIIEAGLGAGVQEYLAFQVHTFPASRSARERWNFGEDVSMTASLVNQPAYHEFAKAGLDECGITTLAGRTVGAPFVGAATAAIVVAELLRMVLGEHCYEIIDGSLRSITLRQIVRSREDSLFNPGSTQATESFCYE